MATPGENGDSRPGALRILLVDDHDGVRSTLRGILNGLPQLSVVGDASNGFEAIAYAHTLRPDVILMDIGMAHMDGIEATLRIRRELPEIQIVGLSMQSRREVTQAIEQAGAMAFFVKGIDTQRLIDHLLAVHSRPAHSPAPRAGYPKRPQAATLLPRQTRQRPIRVVRKQVIPELPRMRWRATCSDAVPVRGRLRPVVLKP